jgi:two-component system nitrogen regulation response regulator NtrX
MQSVLIVDDEPNIRRMLGALLRAEGYEVREAGSGRSALAEVRGDEPDAVMMDLYMPDATGLEVLPELKKAAPDVPVLMMSGRASLSDAVKATKLGAFHFVEKPLAPEAVLLSLRSALELRTARATNRALREELRARDGMVGRTPAIEQVRSVIERVRPTDARVLITGESGTGKEVVASAVHERSARHAGPLVRLNCAAIPRDLVESEMFGTRRAPSPGPRSAAAGRFELASGGTLFWTRSATSAWRRRQSSSAPSRAARWSGWAGTSRSRWTCASWRPPTRTCGPRSRGGASGRTSSSVST